MGLARSGDMVKGLLGEAYALAPHPKPETYWKVTVYLRRAKSPPFTCGVMRRDVEEDIARPGALLAFADPWSTWCAPGSPE